MDRWLIFTDEFPAKGGGQGVNLGGVNVLVVPGNIV